MKYGKRQNLSRSEKVELNKQRNREHARSTRMRRKVFENVLQNQLNNTNKNIELLMGHEAVDKYIERKNLRRQNIQLFFNLMVS
jgi:acetyl-CoA carboxylase beta subunit